MHIYAAHQPEIDAAWSTVERKIDALPASLAVLGRRFLASLEAGSAGHRAYFSSEVAPPFLHLPLWLRDRYRDEGCLYPSSDPAHHAVLAGMWGHLYLRIQANAIERAEGHEPAMLLFANVCSARMYTSLAAGTALTTGFWPAFDRAWSDSARWALEEHRAKGRAAPYTAELFEAHAGKASFARVPALVVCFAAGRRAHERHVTELVHQLGVAYGLVDDLLGWTRALRSGQRTYLLARAGITQADLAVISARIPQAGALHDLARLEARVRRSLFDDGLLCDVLGEAEEWQRRADETASLLELPSFARYTEERVKWLDGLRRQVQSSRLERPPSSGASDSSPPPSDSSPPASGSSPRARCPLVARAV